MPSNNDRVNEQINISALAQKKERKKERCVIETFMPNLTFDFYFVCCYVFIFGFFGVLYSAQYSFISGLLDVFQRL